MCTNEPSGNPTHYYDQFYDQVNWSEGVGSAVVRGIHKKMEKGLKGHYFNSCLELGGGNGQHLDFVLHGFGEYVLLDLRTAQLPDRWENDPRIRKIEANAEKIPFPNGRFDRIVVTCLLHHVDSAENVLSEIERVLKPDGSATIFLPCDPGFLVRIARRLTTQRRAKRLGFNNYGLYIAREHKGHISSVLRIARNVLRSRDIKIKWSPFPFPTWNFNGFAIITVNGKNQSVG